MSLSKVTTQTMSSAEIAAYTKKTHSNVMRDIRTMIEAIFDVDFSDSNVNYLLNQYVKFDKCPQTGRISCYYLDKELTMSLITGYNAKIRHSMVVRWQELEDAAPKELSRLEILTMAIESEQKVIELEDKNKALQSANRTMVSQFTVGLTPSKFARQLNGVNINEIQNYLVDKGILKKHKKGDSVSGYEVAGRYRSLLLKQCYETVGDNKRGYVEVMPKGAEYIYKAYKKEKLIMLVTWNGEFSQMLFDNPPVVHPRLASSQPPIVLAASGGVA